MMVVSLETDLSTRLPKARGARTVPLAARERSGACAIAAHQIENRSLVSSASVFPCLPGTGTLVISVREHQGRSRHLVQTLEAFDSPVNLGNPHEVTILELADKAMRAVGNRVDLIRRPAVADDPSRRCPDVSKASHLLAFAPAVSFEAGLRATVRDFRARLTFPRERVTSVNERANTNPQAKFQVSGRSGDIK